MSFASLNQTALITERVCVGSADWQIAKLTSFEIGQAGYDRWR